MDNAEETLIKQNTEINIQEGNKVPKFIYTTKRGTRNLVVEVDSETRKKTATNQSKTRVDDM